MADEARRAPALRLRLDVSGVVQGVGFRPFVHRLASSLDLAGWARNTPEGLSVEVEGPRAALDEFVRRLSAEAPPLAAVTRVQTRGIPAVGEKAFRIAESSSVGPASVLVAPDASICADCAREMLDPRDRRHRYPFINCTNCGPRYTIIDSLPYDRPRTTMASFTMCADCRREYEDPADRRFHAQPVACPACGPVARLVGEDGSEVARGDEAVRRAREALAQGRIVAVKGLGGFHLAVRADSDGAVRRLRERKRREEKPLAVMARDLACARRLARISEVESRLLESPERPIVLLERLPGAELAPSVAPRSKTYGVMLPYTPLHILLFDGAPYDALVMTSGNRSEEPIAFSNEEAFERLAGIADLWLVHDRGIAVRNDDSVSRVMAGSPVLLRRSRGYAPRAVLAPIDCGRVLALGPMLKNTVCLTRGRECFVSQHIGDLENAETLESLRFTVRHMSEVLGIDPELVACDMHPEYLSTKVSGEFGLPVRRVQHHHAHIAGVLAENALTGPAVGMALDGTGYGPDGTVWGGELLVATLGEFRRSGSLSAVPMPGGDAAAREGWRMALSYETAAFGEPSHAGLDMVSGLGENTLDVVLRMIERGVNSPLTTSCGRLFDAVAAELGICRRSSFEGQAAMELEGAAEAGERGEYPVAVPSKDGRLEIDSVGLFASVARDFESGAPAALVAARFHNSLARALADAAATIARAEGLDSVALSGGCFQNALLLERLVELLREKGLRVVLHRLLPPNDGGLSFGQAVAAAAMGD